MTPPWGLRLACLYSTPMGYYMTTTTQDTQTQTFAQFNLPEALSQALVRMNFTTPTPIQLAAIPAALEGKDVLGSAQTGTGKTGAFGIPLVAKLLGSSRGSGTHSYA
jgi:superfamily II DNA/RNA helicase